MATISGKFDTDTLKNLKTILWGTDIKDEVFMRWTQGKHFLDFNYLLYLLDFKNKMRSESKTTDTWMQHYHMYDYVLVPPKSIFI